MFLDYAAYTSGISWICFFAFTQLKGTISKLNARRKNKIEGQTINHQYGDQLNVIQRSYEEVPWWWSLILFLIPFVVMMAILGTGNLFIPLWTCFIAVVTGVMVVIPLGWLYALSNFQLPIGTFNELSYGLMVNAVDGHKNPSGASVYSSIAGDAWYRAQLMLQDQKIGHYMHIPPWATFFAQTFGCFIGTPINYVVVRWVLNTKTAYVSGAETDPTHQWTGQDLASTLTTSPQYVLIGPRRLFELPTYFPTSALRLPCRCNPPTHNLSSPSSVPQSQIPPLQHHNLFLRSFRFLRKRFNRLYVLDNWCFHRRFLGL